MATDSVSDVPEGFVALNLHVIVSRKEKIFGCRSTGALKTRENGGMAPQIVNHKTKTGDH